jgi:hypothetical protein
LADSSGGKLALDLWTGLHRDKESERNKTTCMLAKYTEYANIGGNKTGGFGETKSFLKQ